MILVVNEQPHDIFKRKGADILMEKEISLLQSLTGVDFAVKHLDGKMLRVKSKAGQVIKPETLMTIEGKGLPFHKNPFEYGNLFVLFKVKFPESLSEAQVDQVASAFGSARRGEDSDSAMAEETCLLEKFNEGQKNTHVQGGTTGDDDEEEDDGHPGGQRVQCAQQ